MIRITYLKGRYWFCVAGAVCVATYPKARKLLESL